ncbi:MAG TPA: NADPH-dependent F420 reductase [Acidimicrobiales bacterium]|nr:NADPH-dependent F420 reductase [Acidimicrobiales bacterium]
MDVGIIGGTGPAGRGLGLRLAAAGMSVAIGSRDPDRAAGVVEELTTVWSSRLEGTLDGVGNEVAASAKLVVLATPWEGAVQTVTALAGRLEGKVVVSMANALVREGREMLPLVHPRGSVAAAVQVALPRSKVAAAFHHLPAREMADLDSGLIADVLVCADDPEATTETMSLVERIDGLRPLDAGSLSQASPIEAFTAVCITLNIRHRAHSTLKLAGI